MRLGRNEQRGRKKTSQGECLEQRGGARGYRKWLPALLLLQMLPVSPVQAEEPRKPDAQMTVAAATERHHFAIPSQRLDMVMAAFSLASGVQYFLDARLTQGVISPGL